MFGCVLVVPFAGIAVSLGSGAIDEVGSFAVAVVGHVAEELSIPLGWWIESVIGASRDVVRVVLTG